MNPGDRIQRYTIVRELGKGGMGTVYEVRADGSRDPLALKVLSERYSMYKSVVARFHREARFQASLQHPGVVQVEELVEDGTTLAIAMEFVSAPTLADVLDEGPMHPERARAVLVDLLGILHACHASGIAHRDLKPENIFVIEERGVVRCKLADFGVAKLLTPTDQDVALTREHSFVGTPRYASPEQVLQSASIDSRSDLYTLGVMGWEMLTGQLPYADVEGNRKLSVAVMDEPLGPLPAHTPPDLHRLIDALTEKEREDRVQSASEALSMLGVRAPSDAGVLHTPEPPADRSPASAAAHTFAFEIPPKVAKPPAPTLPPSSMPAPSPPAPTHPPSVLKPPAPPRPTAVARPRKANFFLRLGARLVDELILQVLVLSCVGIVLYPLAALARGTVGGWSSPGGVATGTRIVNARTGEAASPLAIVLRNAVDLITYQWAIAAILWPIGWLWFVPVVGIVWLILVGWIGPLVALIDKDGRRLADRLAGTRVVVA